MVADGDQTKDEPFTPLGSAAQKVKDKDVEVFAFSTKPKPQTNMADLRQIASKDDNVFAVTQEETPPVIRTKVSNKVKNYIEGKCMPFATSLNVCSFEIFHKRLKLMWSFCDCCCCTS